MKTKIFIAIIVVVIGGVILWRREAGLSSTADQGTDTGTTTPPITLKAYTLSQIALHKDEKSCYTAINGSVYDLTSWIDLHPGGAENILIICGRDGSKDFNDQHGSNQRMQTILASYKIGTLE